MLDFLSDHIALAITASAILGGGIVAVYKWLWGRAVPVVTPANTMTVDEAQSLRESEHEAIEDSRADAHADFDDWLRDAKGHDVPK